MIKTTMNKFFKALIGIALMTGALLVSAKADDKKPDPTGTYVWTMASRTGGPDHTNTLILKLARSYHHGVAARLTSRI